MLIPLTREKFEQIVPLFATGPQYIRVWGKVQDFLRRLLISVVGIVVVLILGLLFQEGGQPLTLILGVVAGLYWLWSPVYLASRRNSNCRLFRYSGFWRGRILEVFITEDLVREEETVNERGELVVIENRERRINLELGDETGFRVLVQAPLNRLHKALSVGQTAELVVLSNQSNLSRISKVTDAYIPRCDLWIGEYPYLQRDFFVQMSRRIQPPEPRKPKRSRRVQDREDFNRRSRPRQPRQRF